jgi:aspartate 1-decarboxylase
MNVEEAKSFKPAVLIVDDENNIVEKTTYLQEE